MKPLVNIIPLYFNLLLFSAKRGLLLWAVTRMLCFWVCYTHTQGCFPSAPSPVSLIIFVTSKGKVFCVSLGEHFCKHTGVRSCKCWSTFIKATPRNWICLSSKNSSCMITDPHFFRYSTLSRFFFSSSRVALPPQLVNHFRPCFLSLSMSVPTLCFNESLGKPVQFFHL